MADTNLAETIAFWQNFIAYADVLQKQTTGAEDVTWTAPNGETGKSFLGYVQELFANFGYLPRFKTLEAVLKNDTDFAAGVEDAIELNDGSYVFVGDDVVDKNGIYIKQDGLWVKSKYDVARLLSSLENEFGSDNILIVKDANNVSALVLTKEGKLYIPSLQTDVASAITERVDDDKSDDSIVAIYDKDGNKTLVQDSNGDLLLPNIGNLTQALSIATSQSAAPTTSNNYNSAKYADYAIAHNTDDEIKKGGILIASTVNASGQIPHPVNLVRIPAITRIASHEYILFYEAREEISDAGTMSFCSAKVAVDPQTFDVTTDSFAVVQQSDAKYNYMQGCGVKLDNGDIITVYMGRNGLYDHKLHMKRSIDNGVTWGEVVDLSHLITDNKLNQISPCSQGLVVRFGESKGRIIVPVWTTQPDVYPDYNSKTSFIYSDDNGLTWHMGTTNMLDEANGGNELQVTEMTNGNLLFAVRGRSWSKRLFIYDTKKDNYSLVEGYDFSSAKIMGGLIQGLNEYDFTTEKLVMVTAKNGDRSGVLIWTSYDDAKTWSRSELAHLNSTIVNYTGIESINAAYLFVIHETETYESIKYNIVPINHTLKGVK